MLKNAFSNGYSSQVRGWLIVDGVQHELAQVGPDFCILRKAIASDFFTKSDLQSDLVVEVDGNRRKIPVLLCSNDPSSAKMLRFRTV